jgi:hypothetical protein
MLDPTGLRKMGNFNPNYRHLDHAQEKKNSIPKLAGGSRTCFEDSPAGTTAVPDRE